MNSQAWIDILPPPPPVDAVSWWVWMVFATILVVLSVVIYLWHKSPKQAALRKLKSIRHSLNEDKDLKQIPFQISHALKLGFKVNHINSINVDNQVQWLEYQQQLTQLCFNKNSPTRDALEISPQIVSVSHRQCLGKCRQHPFVAFKEIAICKRQGNLSSYRQACSCINNPHAANILELGTFVEFGNFACYPHDVPDFHIRSIGRVYKNTFRGFGIRINITVLFLNEDAAC